MAVVKFLKRFFTVIFAFVFAILLLLLLFIVFTKNILSEDNIDKYINSSDIFEIKQEDVLLSNNNVTIGQQISDDFFELGISNEVTDNILNSAGLDKIISKYVFDYIEYILFYKSMPILSSNQIIDVINSEGVKGRIAPEQSLIIDKYIIDTVEKVNDQIPTNQEIKKMGYDVELIKIVSNIIFSKEAFYVVIVCLVLMTLLIGLCSCNLYKMIRTISIPILFLGVFLIVIQKIEVKVMNMLINSDGVIEGMILKIVNESFKDLFIYGISLIVIGLILLIIIAIFAKKPNKEKEILVEPDKENKRAIRENLKDHIALTDDDIDKIDNALLEKNKEIENIILPLEVDTEKPEKISVDAGGELPKVDIKAEIYKENIEKIQPVLIEEKEFIKQTKDNDELIELDTSEEVIEKGIEDEIKVVELENKAEKVKQEILEEDNISYFEIGDEQEEFIKREIDVKPLKNVEIEITNPVKGKDISVVLDEIEEKEEDIELL